MATVLQPAAAVNHACHHAYATPYLYCGWACSAINIYSAIAAHRDPSTADSHADAAYCDRSAIVSTTYGQANPEYPDGDTPSAHAVAQGAAHELS